MNILLVNHYAGSPAHGMEYRPHFMARACSRLGHRTRVVAASFSHLRSRQPAAVNGLRHETVEGIEYSWIGAPPYQGNGLGRVRNMLTFTAGLYRHAAALTADFVPDAVIASSTYPLDVYPAGRIARRHGARLVYEVHDLWPLSLMEISHMRRWHPFIVAMQVAENHAYRAVHRVVSILPGTEPYMREHGLGPGKWSYVPNGIHVEEWEASREPLAETVVRQLADLRRRFPFLLGYAGAHGVANALDALPEAASLLRDSKVAFVLAGQGPEKERLQERVRALQLGNFLFLDPVPRRVVPALLAEMDALYGGFARQGAYRFGVSPNKIMDYMMAAKPVVFAVQEDVGNDLVAESGCGLSVTPGDPAALSGALRRLVAAGPEARAEMGRRGRVYVLEHHTYDVLSKRFIEALSA